MKKVTMLSTILFCIVSSALYLHNRAEKINYPYTDYKNVTTTPSIEYNTSIVQKFEASYVFKAVRMLMSGNGKEEDEFIFTLYNNDGMELESHHIEGNKINNGVYLEIILSREYSKGEYWLDIKSNKKVASEVSIWMCNNDLYFADGLYINDIAYSCNLNCAIGMMDRGIDKTDQAHISIMMFVFTFCLVCVLLFCKSKIKAR